MIQSASSMRIRSTSERCNEGSFFLQCGYAALFSVQPHTVGFFHFFVNEKVE